ncbi:hypothetical protein QH639_19355 [Lysinibacillus sp. 1 U-2021]|uniref:hypothetical protein n=1 Tax=Lysinibacillus sp. 1 U-2021 TaxID=3039426 RepID=UPI00247FC25F|nr:hypothetical protein [Lysinibacillus sp. 1 U-2021]WGT37961.1 hypothetical protein QH639_19355 [Lysinibacillus sp. 1 U-2021]
MVTRRDYHSHNTFKDRVKQFMTNLTTIPTPPTKLKFETWKCDPLHKDMRTHFITVCNDELIEGLQGMELLHGKVAVMDKVSETEYQVEFDNGLVYRLSRYF